MATVNRRGALKAAGSLAAVSSVSTAKRALAATKINPGPKDVLIVVDVQNSFIPGGALAVNAGHEVVPLINQIAKKFQNVVLTQDWHTKDHISFASQHDGKKPFETIKLKYGQQVLWPDHCVQGTEGAAFAPGLDIPHAMLVMRKGLHRQIDSYSAFVEADGKTTTGLGGYLQQRGIKRCYFVGLATDFCVAWSAIDARKEGFQATVIEDACRAIDLNNSLQQAWAGMTKKGVKRMQSADFA